MPLLSSTQTLFPSTKTHEGSMAAKFLTATQGDSSMSMDSQSIEERRQIFAQLAERFLEAKHQIFRDALRQLIADAKQFKPSMVWAAWDTNCYDEYGNPKHTDILLVAPTVVELHHYLENIMSDATAEIAEEFIAQIIEAFKQVALLCQVNFKTASFSFFVAELLVKKIKREMAADEEVEKKITTLGFPAIFAEQSLASQYFDPLLHLLKLGGSREAFTFFAQVLIDLLASEKTQLPELLEYFEQQYQETNAAGLFGAYACYYRLYFLHCYLINAISDFNQFNNHEAFDARYAFTQTRQNFQEAFLFVTDEQNRESNVAFPEFFEALHKEYSTDRNFHSLTLDACVLGDPKWAATVSM